ncbi:cardioactive peptide [Onthophagus taurus]|uniref:cardioactive peptide n=1 Tax=Onthophagus taurus TaxID=166361 RepID=UPI000C2058AD|nr:cardioactive peptide [Onthophagus taurus]
MNSKIILLTAFVVITVYCEATFIPRREGVDYTGTDMILDPKKRPFCNAFTGCGRKRSNIPPLPELPFHFQKLYGQPQHKQRRILDESLSNLLELNSEPGLEDLSRQILSEAKLWEAIQEANMEIRKQQDSNDKQEMMQF